MSYVKRLVDDLGGRARGGSSVRAVVRRESRMSVILDDGAEDLFDDVVFACHSDQALRLFTGATPSEQAMLKRVCYQPNRVVLHSDAKLMPSRRNVWSSWNYLGDTAGSAPAVSVTYWMNPLQGLPGATDYFVSLNPRREPEPDRLLREIHYRHPVFDAAALVAQSALGQIQGGGRVWFCGSYCGYGFHEDGLRSAVEVARGLGVEAPWSGAATAAAPVRAPRPGLAGEAA